MQFVICDLYILLRSLFDPGFGWSTNLPLNQTSRSVHYPCRCPPPSTIATIVDATVTGFLSGTGVYDFVTDVTDTDGFIRTYLKARQLLRQALFLVVVFGDFSAGGPTWNVGDTFAACGTRPVTIERWKLSVATWPYLNHFPGFLTPTYVSAVCHPLPMPPPRPPLLGRDSLAVTVDGISRNCWPQSERWACRG